jgi:hypothetical protein
VPAAASAASMKFDFDAAQAGPVVFWSVKSSAPQGDGHDAGVTRMIFVLAQGAIAVRTWLA